MQLLLITLLGNFQLQISAFANAGGVV